MSIIHVKIPKESTDWEIDDFLGNTLQYKIQDRWVYEVSCELPSNELKIIGLLDEEKSKSLGYDQNWKWIEIQEI